MSNLKYIARVLNFISMISCGYFYFLLDCMKSVFFIYCMNYVRLRICFFLIKTKQKVFKIEISQLVDTQTPFLAKFWALSKPELYSIAGILICAGMTCQPLRSMCANSRDGASISTTIGFKSSKHHTNMGMPILMLLKLNLHIIWNHCCHSASGL